MDPQQPPSTPFQPAVPPGTGGIPPAGQTAAPGQPPAPAASPGPVLMQQVAEQIGSATNVLVTVSSNPSVDQLAATIGLTLILNKLGKHATAVFSGAIPSTIEFLQPEKTLEKTTDSLRDFIVALDKAKADKLRYKIEDKFVKIFITPYHTSIDQKDLEFSQGELNVDAILALGVKKQEELDQAIIAHGRILHDAVVIGVNHQAGANLGFINWNEPDASSLSELIVKLAVILQPGQTNKLLDRQVSTALLTGIVSETDRFSNSKTTPETMSTAAKLMDAGANQQLIATKLEEPKPIPQVQTPPKPKPLPPGVPRPINSPAPGKPAAPPPPPAISADGSLQIPHEEDNIEKIHIDDQGTLSRLEQLQQQVEAQQSQATVAAPPPPPEPAPTPAPPEPPSPVEKVNDGDTLTDIEAAVKSPHLTQATQALAEPPLGPLPDQPSPESAAIGGRLPEPPSTVNNEDRPSQSPSAAPGIDHGQLIGGTPPPSAPPPLAPNIISPTNPPPNTTDPSAGVPL